MPLFVDFNEEWTQTESGTIVSVNGDPRAITRGWNQEDGSVASWWLDVGAVVQQFTFEPVEIDA